MRKIFTSYIKLFLVFLFMLSTSSNISARGKDKKAILLVTFGTSYPSAQKAFDNIDEEVHKIFPNTEIRWAYTSKFIRRKLKKRGEYKDSPAEALAKLGEDGFTHVAVQSLHMIPGLEYDNLVTTVNAFNKMPKGIKVAKMGKPLMYSHHDMLNFSKIMLENISKERKSVDAVIFMGHGTHHMSNIYYPGLQYYTWEIDKHAYIGTVEGSPSLDEIISNLKLKEYKNLLLVPLMSVAGDHAINDMASVESDSWKSQLESRGYKVECLLKGMAEYDSIVNLWIKHLKEIYKQL